MEENDEAVIAEETVEVLPIDTAVTDNSPETILRELADKVPALPPDEVAKLEELIQEIEYVGIDDIHPSPNKARKNRDAIPKVAASIKDLGFRSPIYVDGDRDDEIIAGHTRWYAAKLLGLSRIPIVRITDLTPAKIRLLRLADNKVAEFSGWDFAELNEELKSLKLEITDLDFGELGFLDEETVNVDDFFDDADKDSATEKKEQTCTCPKCGYTWTAE